MPTSLDSGTLALVDQQKGVHVSFRDWVVEEFASALTEVDKSWAESDAARDRGDHWLADEIAKHRRYLDGKQVTLMKAARELGFPSEDIVRDADDIFQREKAEREQYASLGTVTLSMLID